MTLKIIVKVSIVMLVMCAGMPGCDESAPKCSDSETKALVIQIVQRELGEAVSQKVEMELAAIRTTGHDEQTGKYECAADLQMTGPGGESTVPISYTSEITDEGDSFYVTVKEM